MTPTPEPFALLLACALPAEAAPLVRALELRKENRLGVLEYWRHPQDSLFLVVSGIGKLEMAAATAAALSGLSAAVLPTRALNLGIAAAAPSAGPPGKVYQVVKVTDQASARDSFPDLLPETGLSPALLRTVDQPLEKLPTPPTNSDLPILYDMEASGFWQGCRRFLPSDAIHSLKVVTDSGFNPENATRAYAGMKTTWEAAIPEILDAVRILQRLPEPARLEVSSKIQQATEAAIQHLRLTASQGAALRRRLFYSLASGRDPLALLQSLPRQPQPEQAHQRDAAFQNLLHDLLES